MMKASNNAQFSCAIGAPLYTAIILFLLFFVASCKDEAVPELGMTVLMRWNEAAIDGYQYNIEQYVTIDGEVYPAKKTGEFANFKVTIDSTGFAGGIRKIRMVLVRRERNRLNNQVFYRKEGPLLTYDQAPRRITIVDSLFLESGMKTSDSVIAEEGPNSFFIYEVFLEISFAGYERWYNVYLTRKDWRIPPNGAIYLTD